LVLKALSLGPLQGYGVSQRIMRMFEGAMRVEERALYRTRAARVVADEWGMSENNFRARFSTPTRGVRKQLEMEEEN
jgi:PadR family transcriptional regulator, regulatory protein PadR